MATSDAGEPEYESDPEELKRALTRRRREASDDDSDVGDDRDVKNQRDEIDSELSDEEIDALEYDNEEDDGEDSYEEEGDGTVDNEKNSVVKEAGGELDGEDEKEKQHATVPTGGAFYMHDDRFQEMSARGSRRTRGGRRPWGSGEERKWGHDKFEEMNTRDKHNDRTSRGRFRGRGRGRGRRQERGYARGSSSNTSTGNGQQIYLPKAATRGRGPRKFETPQTNETQAHSDQSKQLRNSNGSQNFNEKMSHLDSRRSPAALVKTGNEGVYVKKNVAASSLSSASPPFYPSVPSSTLVHSIQGGMERLHMNESAAPSGKKYRNTKPVYPPVWTAKTSQSTSQGRGVPATGNAFYPQSHSQGDKFSSPMPQNGDSKESVLETSRSIGKGKGTLRPSGSSALMHNGSQMMGRAESLPSADNSTFPNFLHVMQFGGQHGGVPTFGMAFPGYVQSEHGVRNPEMTWMPVLTGPGALGAPYGSSYVANQAHELGLPSSLGSSSKENSTNNLIDLENPMERPEVTERDSQQPNNNPSKLVGTRR